MQNKLLLYNQAVRAFDLFNIEMQARQALLEYNNFHHTYWWKSGYSDEKKFAFAEAFTSVYRNPSAIKYTVLI